MTSTLVIPLAYLLDLLLGDPRWLPHPVRWIGRYIIYLEGRIRSFIKNPSSTPLYQREKGGIRAERIGGLFLFIIVVGTVFGFAWSLLYLAYQLSSIAYYPLSIFIAYTTLSIKSLHQEATWVMDALKDASSPFIPPPQGGRVGWRPSPQHLRGEGGVGGHLDEARKRLSNIVGRDTHNLSEEEIYRAVTETVAENTSDGIIAPLLYLAIGGPVLAITYKAVNTLDSMVGYKNERYRDLGWFSARMDDLVNYIPARIAAILMVLSAFILRLDWKGSLKTVWRYSRCHPSPNAGYPESAMAGALGVRLGGVNYYGGIPQERPFIGEMKEGFSMDTVRGAIKMIHLTALLGVMLTSGLFSVFIGTPPSPLWGEE